MASLLNIHSTFLCGESSHCLVKQNSNKTFKDSRFSFQNTHAFQVFSSKIEGTSSLSETRSIQLNRRDACISSLIGLGSLGLNLDSAFAAASVSVGSYLPKANEGNFVVFKPASNSTPALRAGNVSPYTFFIPPSWTQSRIANILSGNYCQPKCAEPWIEVKFEDPRQGTLSVVASPMVRLTNKPNSTIEEIGSPETIISALGPFVTGDSYDPEEVVETNIRTVDGQTYYDYVLETPYARSGTHNLAAATAKGSTVLLFVVSANDAQWSSSEKILRRLVKSFNV